MKAAFSVTLMTALLAACAPIASPTPHATEEIVQLLTPTVPEGTIFFEECTYMVSYPPELTTTDGILFQSPNENEKGEMASVFITARRRTDAEQDLPLDVLANQASAQWTSQTDPVSFGPTEVIDYLGHTLDGLQADFADDKGQHIRLMIVVRPHTLLGDLLADDVVYEVVAQAPEAMWSEWVPLFEAIFQTFHPKDCGGV